MKGNTFKFFGLMFVVVLMTSQSLVASADTPSAKIAVVDARVAIFSSTAAQNALKTASHRSFPQMEASADQIAETIEALENAQAPIFYTGGGVINSGPEASARLRQFQDLTGAPVTSTLMGLGCFPATHPERGD